MRAGGALRAGTERGVEGEWREGPGREGGGRVGGLLGGRNVGCHVEWPWVGRVAIAKGARWGRQCMPNRI